MKKIFLKIIFFLCTIQGVWSLQYGILIKDVEINGKLIKTGSLLRIADDKALKKKYTSCSYGNLHFSILSSLLIIADKKNTESLLNGKLRVPAQVIIQLSWFALKHNLSENIDALIYFYVDNTSFMLLRENTFYINFKSFDEFPRYYKKLKKKFSHLPVRLYTIIQANPLINIKYLKTIPALKNNSLIDYLSLEKEMEFFSNASTEASFYKRFISLYKKGEEEADSQHKYLFRERKIELMKELYSKEHASERELLELRDLYTEEIILFKSTENTTSLINKINNIKESIILIDRLLLSKKIASQNKVSYISYKYTDEKIGFLHYWPEKFINVSNESAYNFAILKNIKRLFYFSLTDGQLKYGLFKYIGHDPDASILIKDKLFFFNIDNKFPYKEYKSIYTKGVETEHFFVFKKRVTINGHRKTLILPGEVSFLKEISSVLFVSIKGLKKTYLINKNLKIFDSIDGEYSSMIYEPAKSRILATDPYKGNINIFYFKNNLIFNEHNIIKDYKGIIDIKKFRTEFAGINFHTGELIIFNDKGRIKKSFRITDYPLSLSINDNIFCIINDENIVSIFNLDTNKIKRFNPIGEVFNDFFEEFLSKLISGIQHQMLYRISDDEANYFASKIDTFIMLNNERIERDIQNNLEYFFKRQYPKLIIKGTRKEIFFPSTTKNAYFPDKNHIKLAVRFYYKKRLLFLFFYKKTWKFDKKDDWLLSGIMDLPKLANEKVILKLASHPHN